MAGKEPRFAPPPSLRDVHIMVSTEHQRVMRRWRGEGRVFLFALYESAVPAEADEAHDAKDLEDALSITVEASRDIMRSEIKSGRLPRSEYIVVQTVSASKLESCCFEARSR